jgi:hypothetical protein
MVMVRVTVAAIIIMIMLGIVASYCSVTLVISGGAPVWPFPCPWLLADAIE